MATASAASGPAPSCKHNLYLDVFPETGSIKWNFPDLEVWDLEETCSLDKADLGGLTMKEVGDMINVTREGARLIAVRAKDRARNPLKGVAEERGIDPDGRGSDDDEDERGDEDHDDEDPDDH